MRATPWSVPSMTTAISLRGMGAVARVLVRSAKWVRSVWLRVRSTSQPAALLWAFAETARTPAMPSLRLTWTQDAGLVAVKA